MTETNEKNDGEDIRAILRLANEQGRVLRNPSIARSRRRNG